MKKEDVVVNSEKQGWNANSGVPTSKRSHLKVIQKFFFQVKKVTANQSLVTSSQLFMSSHNSSISSQRLCRV